MKYKVALLLTLIFLSAARAEDARFFRIAGPVASTITAFTADGYVTWTNAPTNATFTVQTALSLVGPSNWVDYIQVPATNPVTSHRLYDPNPPAGMVLIPAGSFTMGDTLDDVQYHNAIPTNATVSAFYMDVNLVSFSQWQTVYNWATNQGYGFANFADGKAANHPVQSVNWYDTVKWSNARSQQAGLTPVYYTDAGLTQVYTNGEVTPHVNWTANGYRLPTEAEWEKAARGGLSGRRFPWGDTDSITHNRANYNSSAINGYDTSSTRGYHPAFNDGVYPYTSPVGYFAPNGYGLYDMAGNVWQWCWDWYGTPYGQPTTTNPTGPGTGSSRVLRGGNWSLIAEYSRCANRGYGYLPFNAFIYFGFRCVRGL